MWLETSVSPNFFDLLDLDLDISQNRKTELMSISASKQLGDLGGYASENVAALQLEGYLDSHYLHN